jgi:hypothetical protein
MGAGGAGMSFDGRKLGELFDVIRPLIPEFAVFGGMNRHRQSHVQGALLKCYGAFRAHHRALFARPRVQTQAPPG